MLAKEIASNQIPALYNTDKIEKIKSITDKYKISHIPVIDSDSYFKGLITDISSSEINTHTLISELESNFDNTYIFGNQHFFDVFDIISSKQISLVPVIDENFLYIGNISQQTLIENISQLLSLKAPGGIIIIEVYFRDYSLAEISQIVESNGAKIFNVCTTQAKNSDFFDVTIKLNTDEITSIIETFIRYNYNVKSYFGEYHKLEDLYKSRIEEFRKFINI